MKIAIVYDVVYPYRYGGGEKRNWEVARRLVARGHEVTLVSIQMWNGASELTRDGVSFAGVCPWREGLYRDGKRTFREPFYFARYAYRYLRKGHWDVIDCGNFPYLPCIAAWAATRRRRGRLVITWYETRGLKRWIAHKGWLAGAVAWVFELVVSRLTSQNVMISKLTADRSREILGMRATTTIPCGVDCAAIAPPEADRNLILYVGRLVDYKRVDILIEAFKELADDFPQYDLRIVGKGSHRQPLEQLANRLGLSGRASFVDSLDETALRREYASAKIFALPSEQEGFGIVLIEAMSAGTPVVALDAPDSAAAGLVADGANGLLAAGKDEMIEAMRRLLSDDELWSKLAQKGMETAAEHDWDQAVIPRLEEYYRRVAASEQGATEQSA